MPLYEINQNDYYSINIEEIHFISLNLLNPLTTSENLQKWLEKDLAKFHQLNKWIILLINKPIFMQLDDFSKNELEFYASLQEIFKEFNVDLVITIGGDHYKRTMPMVGQKIYSFKNYDNVKHHKKCYSLSDCDNEFMVDPEAPIYISESYNEITKENNETNFTIVSNNKEGFGMIQSLNRTHLLFEQLGFKGELIDRFFLIKSRNIGVLEPMPLENKSNEINHIIYLIMFLVVCLVFLLGVLIWYVRKKYLSHKEKFLINYEMQSL